MRGKDFLGRASRKIHAARILMGQDSLLDNFLRICSSNSAKGIGIPAVNPVTVFSNVVYNLVANLIEKNSSQLAAGLNWVYDRAYTQET